MSRRRCGGIWGRSVLEGSDGEEDDSVAAGGVVGVLDTEVGVTLSLGTEGLVSSELGGVGTLGWLTIALLSSVRAWIRLILCVLFGFAPVSLVLVLGFAIPTIRVLLSLWSFV